MPLGDDAAGAVQTDADLARFAAEPTQSALDAGRVDLEAVRLGSDVAVKRQLDCAVGERASVQRAAAFAA